MGWNNEQFAVYYGAEYEPGYITNCKNSTSSCTLNLAPRTVLMWNAEYNTYGNGSNINLTYKYDEDGTWKKYYNINDHLGNVRTVLRKDGTAGTPVKQFFYTPFGSVIPLLGDVNRTKFIGKEKDKESNYADHGVRKYDDEIGRFTSIDPLWEKYYSLTPYQYAGNNPVSFFDGNGLNWFRNQSTGEIKWLDQTGDFGDAKTFEIWDDIGANVIVAKHGRGKNFKEDVEAATFEMYLETNHKGPSAVEFGNTVPSNISKRGVLQEGLYEGIVLKKKINFEDRGDLVILLGNGGALPSLKPNPAQKNKYEMTEIFLHWGYNEENRKPYISSWGCQTIAPGRKDDYNKFVNNLRNVKVNPVGMRINYLLMPK